MPPSHRTKASFRTYARAVWTATRDPRSRYRSRAPRRWPRRLQDTPPRDQWRPAWSDSPPENSRRSSPSIPKTGRPPRCVCRRAARPARPGSHRAANRWKCAAHALADCRGSATWRHMIPCRFQTRALCGLRAFPESTAYTPWQSPNLIEGRNSDAGLLHSVAVTFAHHTAASSQCLVAIDHPGDVIAIDHHAEARGPESLLESHPDLPAIGECIEDPFAFGNRRHLQRDRETLRLRITSRRRIGRHQQAFSDRHACMHDLTLPFRRHVRFRGRPGVRHHHFDFAASDMRVELEGFFAIAVEQDVGVHAHNILLIVADRCVRISAGALRPSRSCGFARRLRGGVRRRRSGRNLPTRRRAGLPLPLRRDGPEFGRTAPAWPIRSLLRAIWPE